MPHDTFLSKRSSVDYGQITLRYHIVDSLTIIVTADASSQDCDVASMIHPNF